MTTLKAPGNRATRCRAATTITGASGNGQVVFSTETVKKSYTVTATVAGIGALTFQVVGL